MKTQSDFDRPEVLKGMGYACSLAIVVIALYGAVDYILLSQTEPERLLYCIYIRLAIAASCAVFVYLAQRFMHTPDWEKSAALRAHVIAGAIAYLIIGIGVIMLISLVDGPYFAGLMMVFFGIAMMTPWRPLYSIILFSILTAIYLAVTFRTDPRAVQSAGYLTSLVFLVGAAVVSVYGAAVTYRLHVSTTAKPDQGLQEDTIERVRLIHILIRSAVVLIAPILGLVTAYYQWWGPVRATPSAPYLLELNAVGEKDESFEFVNLTGSPIVLDRGQIVINGTNRLDIVPDDANHPKCIGNGARFRIYTRRQPFDYHLGQTNAILINVARSQVRLYGFRVSDPVGTNPPASPAVAVGGVDMEGPPVAAAGVRQEVSAEF